MLRTPPLGLLQLRHRPLRLLVALAGIGFAVLLILMQLGFRAALFESAVRYQERFRYGVALFSRDSQFIVRPQTFPIERLYQVLAVDGVSDVSPVYIFPSVWRNPWNHERRSVFTVGVDPDETLDENPYVHEKAKVLIDDYETDRRFDLVTLRMVAEHVAEPWTSVRTAVASDHHRVLS